MNWTDINQINRNIGLTELNRTDTNQNWTEQNWIPVQLNWTEPIPTKTDRLWPTDSDPHTDCDRPITDFDRPVMICIPITTCKKPFLTDRMWPVSGNDRTDKYRTHTDTRQGKKPDSTGYRINRPVPKDLYDLLLTDRFLPNLFLTDLFPTF